MDILYIDNCFWVTTKMRVKSLLAVCLSVQVILFSSCRKLVEIAPPTTATTGASVYQEDGTAASVLTGLYSNMSSGIFSSGGVTNLSLLPALSSDELTLYSGSTNATFIQYYKNALISSNTSTTYYYWNNIYPFIYVCNSAIEGLTGASTLTPKLKSQLLGEAKFMRAFFYFYLVNLYGDVPLVTGTDYTVNAVLPRAPKANVYKNIISDLRDAENELSDNYVDATILNTTNDRVRPNKYCASALLARVYLFTSDWGNAELKASAVIADSSIYQLTGLNNVFLANNNEAIWQLQPVNAGQNTQDARLFIIPSTGFSSTHPVYLSSNLMNGFEIDDQRMTNWTKSIKIKGIIYNYPFKYKVSALNAPVTEYLMILRLAEQFLIRAEARAQQGDILGAQADLNTIRSRAGLPNTLASDQSSLLAAILHERQVELFTEWGHRWLDLKRTNTVDQVMGTATPQKGGSWSSDWQLYPISLFDLQRDPSLVQNHGY